jgi:hypothetical protein
MDKTRHASPSPNAFQTECPRGADRRLEAAPSFHKLIALLADKFTIIAPSLPGYTLSFKPGQARFGVTEIADVFAELMRDVLGLGPRELTEITAAPKCL